MDDVPGQAIDDMREMEVMLDKTTDIDCTVVRPPGLTNEPGIGMAKANRQTPHQI